MPRLARGLNDNRVFISPSQEEALEGIVLEAIAGWDAVHNTPRITDETPSQPAYAENSSESFLQRVLDGTGSTASQEAVVIISPNRSSRRTPASDVAMREEDSYNEAFESDRSQSPKTTLSWSLAAAPAHGCCSKDPKSPTSVTVAADEEIEKSPLKLKVMSEVSNRLRDPPEPGVTTALTVELQLHQDARATEQDAEETSGRREVSAILEADCGGGVVKMMTADIEARPPVSAIGVRVVSPRGSSLAGDVPASKPSSVWEGFGSGSASAFTSLRRKEKDTQAALSVEPHTTFGFEGGTRERSANFALDEIAISVQANMQVLDNMVVEDDHSEKETNSGSNFERMRFRVQHELNSLEKIGERGVRLETDPIRSTGLWDEVENPSAAVHRQDGLRVEVLSGKEKSKELSRSQTSSRVLRDATKLPSVDKPVAEAAPENVSQLSPPSPPRPPRAVQEKLERLRSQSGNKRAHSENLDLLMDRLRTERDNISSSTALEAIKLRSGERSGGEVTAADLLKTALAVGIALPPPFHKNYFCG